MIALTCTKCTTRDDTYCMIHIVKVLTKLWSLSLIKHNVLLLVGNSVGRSVLWQCVCNASDPPYVWEDFVCPLGYLFLVQPLKCYC